MIDCLKNRRSEHDGKASRTSLPLSHERGDLLLLKAFGGQVAKVNPVFTPLNLFDQDNFTTGLVEVSPDGTARLETASPAILTSLIEVDASFHALEFSFDTDEPGLLSVYFEGEQIFGVESTNYSEGPTSSGMLWLGEEYAAGSYSLTFRIDPLSEETVVAQIANLQFIHFTEVAGLAGDFNGDGSVDGADLTAWTDGFGASGDATHSQGDADGDRDVDGADFLAWQRQVGSPLVQEASAVVPEPAVNLMILLAIASFAAKSVCSRDRKALR